MDFISPLFGRQGIQFANGEDAKHRMNTFNYFLRKDAIEEYCPIFEKVSKSYVCSELTKLTFSITKTNKKWSKLSIFSSNN